MATKNIEDGNVQDDVHQFLRSLISTVYEREALEGLPQDAAEGNMPDEPNDVDTIRDFLQALFARVNDNMYMENMLENGPSDEAREVESIKRFIQVLFAIVNRNLRSELMLEDGSDNESEIFDDPDGEDLALVRLRRSLSYPQVRHRFNPNLEPFRCNICALYVRGGVVTICGHLYCWPCLWPKLCSELKPKCPCCGKMLTLHEDIMPFHGEGPDANPEDAHIVAQPGDVPRPTGLYLQESASPNWFWIHAVECYMPLGNRNIPSLMLQVADEFKKTFACIKGIQWFLVGWVVAMSIIFYYCMCLE